MSTTLFRLKHIGNATELDIQDVSSIIGRSDNCQLRFDATSLSREHARFSVRDDGLFLQDLHSTNGTYVNERLISEITEVKIGDTLRFGQERFSLQGPGTDATLMFDKRAALDAESAVMVEDEDEADATVMLQSISLPPGWQGASEFSRSVSVNDGDQKLLVALQAHAQGKMKHKHGLLVTVLEEGKAPLVKLLSTSDNSANWRIGRDESNDIALNDQRISHLHAQIEFLQGGWKIVDLKSRNGLYSEGKLMRECVVGSKTEIEIGPFLLILKSLEK